MTRKDFLQASLIVAGTGMLSACDEQSGEKRLVVNEKANKQATFLPKTVYPFEHHETTGVTSFLKIGTNNQAIQFANDGDNKHWIVCTV